MKNWIAGNVRAIMLFKITYTLHMLAGQLYDADKNRITAMQSLKVFT